MEKKKQNITLEAPTSEQRCISVIFTLLRELRENKNLAHGKNAAGLNSIAFNGVDVFCAGVLQGQFDWLDELSYRIDEVRYEQGQLSASQLQEALQMLKHYIVVQHVNKDAQKYNDQEKKEKTSECFTDFLCRSLQQIEKFKTLNLKT